MVKIFFFSEAGYAPMKDPVLKGLTGSHGWQPDGETWVYGVCTPRTNVDPLRVEKALTELGITVLPGINDPDRPDPDPKVHKALAKHGIVPGDKTHQIARKMHVASGMPVLQPHFH